MRNWKGKPFNVADFGGLSEDEYVKDEVIYCKKCNTPRMFVNDEYKIRCICKCQEAARDAIEEEKKKLYKLNKIEKLQAASLMGDRYKSVTFEQTELTENETFRNAYMRCKKYSEVSEQVLDRGLGIYLYGDKGTGKTHLTACIANSLMTDYKQVLFTNFAEISKLIRSTFNNNRESEAEYINKIANVDFLFIDDLGTERVQSAGGEDLWLQEKTFEVLNKRYNARKPTVFTSNYSLQELITDRGYMDKTVDRIAEMSNAIIKLEGESYRMKARAAINLPF